MNEARTGGRAPGPGHGEIRVLRRRPNRRPRLVGLATGVAAILAASALLGAPHGGIPGPVGLSESFIDAVLGELSGEEAWRTVYAISSYYREDATPGFGEAVQHLVGKLESYGFAPHEIQVERFLSDNQTSYLNKRTRYGWVPRSAELWLESPTRRKLADFDDVSTSLATWSVSADVRAELVYVGDGLDDDDYPAADLVGKIVLTESLPSTIQHEAVARRGAEGIVSFWASPERLEYPDLVNWLDTANNREEVKAFGFVLSRRVGVELRDRLLQGETLTVHARVDADLVAGQLEILSATIPGTHHPDEQVVFIAHLCHFSPSSNDNASGVAAILEIARTLKTLIDRGIIEAPRRTIRFFWVPENYGTIAYLSAHPEFPDRTLAAINLDMVGEDLAKTGAVFRVFSTPDSLPSYIDAVVEQFVRLCDELDVHAITGSTAPFNYRFMSSAFGSDHYWLNDAGTGVPTAFLSHWPDTYYHTNQDSPDKSDPTELKRVSFIALASLWRVANMTPQEVVPLLAVVDLRAVRRAAEAFADASHIIDSADPSEALRALHRAEAVLALAGQARSGELASVARFATADPERGRLVAAAVQRARQEADLATRALHGHFRDYCRERPETSGCAAEDRDSGSRLEAHDGENRVPRRKTRFLSGLWAEHLGALSDEEREWIREFRQRIGDTASTTYEILNFVDGTRTLEEIRRLAEVEQFSDDMIMAFFGRELLGLASDGKPAPYRTITPDDLGRFLSLLEKAGLIDYEER